MTYNLEWRLKHSGPRSRTLSSFFFFFLVPLSFDFFGFLKFFLLLFESAALSVPLVDQSRPWDWSTLLGIEFSTKRGRALGTAPRAREKGGQHFWFSEIMNAASVEKISGQPRFNFFLPLAVSPAPAVLSRSRDEKTFRRRFFCLRAA